MGCGSKGPRRSNQAAEPALPVSRPVSEKASGSAPGCREVTSSLPFGFLFCTAGTVVRGNGASRVKRDAVSCGTGCALLRLEFPLPPRQGGAPGREVLRAAVLPRWALPSAVWQVFAVYWTEACGLCRRSSNPSTRIRVASDKSRVTPSRLHMSLPTPTRFG